MLIFKFYGLDTQSHKAFLISFGKNLTRLRKKQKISRVQLAFEIGTHEKQLRLIEKGEINTGILTIYKICKALHVEVTELFNFEF